MAVAGCEPTNLGTKGQHATCRPPKLLNVVDSYQCLGSTYTFHPWVARVLFCFEYEGARFLENVEF